MAAKSIKDQILQGINQKLSQFKQSAAYSPVRNILAPSVTAVGKSLGNIGEAAYQSSRLVTDPVFRTSVMGGNLNKYSLQDIQKSNQRPTLFRNEQNLTRKKLLTTEGLLPAVQTGLLASGLAKPVLTATTAALGSAIGGGIGYAQGGSKGAIEGASRAIGAAPMTAGLLRYTNPLQGAGVNAATNLVGRMATGATLNVGEGILLDKLLERPTTKTSVGIDAAIGSVFPLARAGVKAFKGDDAAGIPPPKEVMESKDPYVRDAWGKFAKNVKAKLVKMIGSGEIDPKRPTDFVRTSERSYKLFYKDTGEPVLKSDFTFNLGNKQSGEASSRLLTDMGGAAVGSLAGLDPQKDEQGNFKLGYNIPRGVSGALIGGFAADTFRPQDANIEISGIAGKITPELKANADYARSFETYTDFRKALADQGRMADFDSNVAKGGFTSPEDFWKASLATKYSGPITEQLPMGMSAKSKGSVMDAEVQKNQKYAFSINKPKLGLNGKEAKKLDKVVEQIRPLLEKNKGKALTHAEIVEAGRGAKMLGDVMGREESKKFAESLQASRNFVKTQAGKKGLTPEYLAQLEIVNSVAADAGRKLNAFGTMAEDAGIKEKVLKDLLKLEGDTAAMLKAGKNVDWDNAKEVTDFYRQFKPASLADKLAEFRYTNMLSSPNTHIVNTFSNVLQTALITPVEKTLRGGLDFATSRLTGREQQYFARQGVDYAGGYWKSLPEAFTKFKDTISGAGGLNKPDINFIPTSTSKLQRAYTTPLRVLEASDQFFRTLTKGGEIASLKTEGITGAKAAKLAEESADYRTFRQAFDPEGKLGQGDLFKVWDKYNVQINRLRNLPGGNWIVPFLQTPTNILKQGVEYSPAGLLTMKGARDPLGQLSKAIIGTTVFSGAYALANSGLTTWDAPTGADARAEFYAAGLQPYSVKMGDKWVSYSKLGPLSYPIAMASALKWAQDEGGAEDILATSGKAIGGTLGFFADQSYVRGIGDFIDAARGDEFKQSRALTNIPAQLVPYRSFMGWVTRLVDPIYRKTSGGTIPEQIGKSLISQVPGMSQNIEAYQTPFGEDSKRQFPLLNAFSPLSVTQEQGGAKEFYDAREGERDMNKQINQQIDSIEGGDGKTASGNIDIEGKRKIAKKKIEAGMDVSDEELVLVHGVDKLISKNPVTAVAKAKHEEDLFEKATAIYRDEDLDDESKRKLIDTLGVNNDDVLYYDLATENAMIKKVAINEEISTLLVSSKDRGDLVRKLASYRREVSGEMVLSDTIITDLVNDGTISKEEGKVLKDTKYNTDGSLKVKVTGRGAGAKLKSIKTKRIKMSTKLPTIKSTSRKYSMKTPDLKVDAGGLKVKLPSSPKYAVKFNV